MSVDALNGMPGVLSARWSGRHGDDAANNDLLLGQLATCPTSAAAPFVSACALVADGEEVVMLGEWPGRIARKPRGDGGFGYDPLFVPAGQHRTSAQLSAEEKDAESHRGRALRMLVPHLQRL